MITGTLTDRHASDTLLAITTMKAVGAALLLAGLLVLSIERYGRELFRRFHDRQRQGRRQGAFAERLLRKDDISFDLLFRKTTSSMFRRGSGDGDQTNAHMDPRERYALDAAYLTRVIKATETALKSIPKPTEYFGRG